MCGIFFSCDNDNNEYNLFTKISHRGPESSSFQVRNDFVYGFHRLGIIHPQTNYNQPFFYRDVIVLCNGEIYNWKQLIKEYDLPSETELASDCEVLGYLYQKLNRDFEQTVSLLDGEFAIILHDCTLNLIYASRDFMGIRPLYYATSGPFKIASEMKCFNPSTQSVQHILPRFVYKFQLDNDKKIQNVYMKKYWDFPQYNVDNKNEDQIIDELYSLLYKSIESRLTETERPIGCLLSGGLDSSLIVSIASKINPNIRCFTIGLENSPDVRSAKIVSEYLDVNLCTIPFDIKTAINTIPDVVKCLETYDITTIRASTPQYFIANYIRKHTDIKVVLSGEGSDEIFSGYLYSKLATNSDDLWKDGIRLLSELYLFDCLRTDRTISSSGLEVRVPFLNKELVDYVLRLNPEVRMCNARMEKFLLRKMAEKYSLLPESIYTRQKEAFSDAVSNETTSWYKSIQKAIYPLKERDWYKQLFMEVYPNQEHILPHYWMPKWSDTDDPSATTLKVWSSNKLIYS